MLRITDLQLVHFRNYRQQNFHFTRNIIAICGNNGSGKTNLLDAIYYLSFSKSYFPRNDASNILHSEEGFRLQGNYLLNDEPKNVTCILRNLAKKELLLNEVPYKKFSEHIGLFPSVMIAPDDVTLITGLSEERRKFIDTLIAQFDTRYLQAVIQYTRILQQRNGFLKQLQETNQGDPILLDTIDEQLSHEGDYIYSVREKFMKDFIPLVQSLYYTIAQKEEGLFLTYESQLTGSSLLPILKKNIEKDRLLVRTSAGIHKDDIGITMNGINFKTEASQGQRKSLLFAFKLAEWQTLKTKKGFSPILLMDDIFEKLDESRMYELLRWVCRDVDTQVFITDTHAERLKKQLQSTEQPFEFIQL